MHIGNAGRAGAHRMHHAFLGIDADVRLGAEKAPVSLRVWCISGSRSFFSFLVDEGAWIMVASTMVPVVMRMPRLARKMVGP